MENPTETQALTPQQRGGLSRSPAKIEAARHNGKKGGRPLKRTIHDIWQTLEPYDEGKYPQLPYPGGKARLAPHILKMMPRSGRVYVEPFAGRCNLFWAVASELHYKHYWLNDTRTVPFLRAVKKVGNTVNVPERTEAEYYCHWQLAQTGDEVAIAMEPYFTFSGAGYGRGGFKRGTRGVSQAGYKRTLSRCHKILNSIDPWLTELDWVELGLANLTEDDFVYFDPPYKDCDTRSYSAAGIDHEHLVECLVHANYNWILSEYPQPLYFEVFGEPTYQWQVQLAGTNFRMENGGRRRTVECVWKNF